MTRPAGTRIVSHGGPENKSVFLKTDPRFYCTIPAPTAKDENSRNTSILFIAFLEALRRQSLTPN
jgi:hypothetical protein